MLWITDAYAREMHSKLRKQALEGFKSAFWLAKTLNTLLFVKIFYALLLFHSFIASPQIRPLIINLSFLVSLVISKGSGLKVQISELEIEITYFGNRNWYSGSGFIFEKSEFGIGIRVRESGWSLENSGFEIESKKFRNWDEIGIPNRDGQKAGSGIGLWVGTDPGIKGYQK